MYSKRGKRGKSLTKMWNFPVALKNVVDKTKVLVYNLNGFYSMSGMYAHSTLLMYFDGADFSAAEILGTAMA